MTAGPTVSGPLGPAIHDYLALKRTLGRGYALEGGVLRSLDRFLGDLGATDLEADGFAAWCRGQERLAPGVQRNQRRIVRNFCLYRRRTRPGCFVPDPRLFPRPHQPIRPYILSEDEVARLLSKASLMKPSANSPLRPAVFRLAIVLLYTTGLRRGELLRLAPDDYDGERAVLTIRASKFHKSRVLPVPPDVAGEIGDYVRLRRCHLADAAAPPLLCNRSRQAWRGYTGTGLSDGIRSLLVAAEVRRPDGRLPRVHDFRHSFAVNALLRWYRQGVGVGTKLPGLAAYMGHVSIASTHCYLQLVEPIRTAASDRFERSCGRLVTALVERTTP